VSEDKLSTAIEEILSDALAEISGEARAEYAAWIAEIAPLVSQWAIAAAAGDEIAADNLAHVRGQAEAKAALLKIESYRLSAGTAGKIALAVALAAAKLI
jgi:hypothetical protein